MCVRQKLLSVLVLTIMYFIILFLCLTWNIHTCIWIHIYLRSKSCILVLTHCPFGLKHVAFIDGILSFRILTEYKMYRGVEFSWKISLVYSNNLTIFFCLFIEVSLTQNNYHSARILLFTYGVFFFQIQLDHFVHMEGALFVQQLRTEKQTWNSTSAQNGCARTTLSRQFK
jgi:hypothetical protein